VFKEDTGFVSAPRTTNAIGLDGELKGGDILNHVVVVVVVVVVVIAVVVVVAAVVVVVVVVVLVAVVVAVVGLILHHVVCFDEFSEMFDFRLTFTNLLLFTHHNSVVEEKEDLSDSYPNEIVEAPNVLKTESNDLYHIVGQRRRRSSGRKHEAKHISQSTNVGFVEIHTTHNNKQCRIWIPQSIRTPTKLWRRPTY
jgi:hypothetical protein